MDHSYEEIRSAALDLLAGREEASYDLSQYEHVLIGVAEVFQRRGENLRQRSFGSGRDLSQQDRELFREVFWELFRQGIITLGRDDSNRNFPFFRVSSFGKKLLAGKDAYFFASSKKFVGFNRFR
jgi:hypothetical protein